MSYYEDLTPYEFLPGDRPALNVGWLDSVHQYTTGDVAEPLREILRRLAVTAPTNQTRGFHHCELCDLRVSETPTVEWSGKSRHLGSAEIWVALEGGPVYACPDLIVHYVEVHNYCPPAEFLAALEKN